MRIGVLTMLMVVLLTGSAMAQHESACAKLATEVLQEINAYRAGKKLRPLAMDAVIAPIAEGHSRNMACGKVAFGHDGFEGRMARISKKIKPINAWAENVAAGPETAKDVVELWLGSDDHRANIEGDYNLTGIGITRGPEGYYYTQIFINKPK